MIKASKTLNIWERNNGLTTMKYPGLGTCAYLTPGEVPSFQNFCNHGQSGDQMFSDGRVFQEAEAEKAKHKGLGSVCVCVCV